MELHAFPALALITTIACAACASRPTNDIAGAYRLVSLEEAGVDGTSHRADCTGSLVLTPDGRMSVQVMYRNAETPANAGPVQYAQGGYEASFGHYSIVEAGRSFTYHVEGALVRGLVGQDQKRLYELRGKQLVITPPTTNEHWRVIWERYGGAL